MILESGKTYAGIHGVPRGGLVPAVILSHALELPYIWNASKLTMDNLDVLIVDDLVDTGRTLKSYYDLGFDVATPYVKSWRSFTPRYFVEEIDKWLVFPWEVL
jgi:hypoxanthine phosphoribosyltransferase